MALVGVDDGDGNPYEEVGLGRRGQGPVRQGPSVATMVEFADVIGNFSGNFKAMLDIWMHRDVMMRYIVVDRSIDHWDGIVGLYDLPGGNHNYYWYEAAGSKLRLIPWDLDHTLEWPLFADRCDAPLWNDTFRLPLPSLPIRSSISPSGRCTSTSSARTWANSTP